jgi:hypothetical protein
MAESEFCMKPDRRLVAALANDGDHLPWARVLDANQAAYVDTAQAVHKVCNPSYFGQRAISVHVYQQPMSECEVYSLQEGTYEARRLDYTSEHGKLNPSARL